MKQLLSRRLICGTVLSVSLLGCADQSFKQLGSSILSSTGLVSASQADAMFEAGSKIAAAAGPLTSEQEYYLGRAVSAMILSRYPLSTNTALNNYVNTVGNALVAYSDQPETFGGYHFAVIETDEVNALSAPGGFVFVSRGLLRLVSDEDSLAAVLAHEIGHVALGHGVKAISQANLSSAVMILGREAASSYGGEAVRTLTNALGDSVSEVFETLVNNGYSRSQEYDADEFAVGLLRRVGYPESSLVTMLHSLKGVPHQEGGLFDTHPSPEKRMSELPDDVVDPSSVNAAAKAGASVREMRFKRAVKNG